MSEEITKKEKATVQRKKHYTSTLPIELEETIMRFYNSNPYVLLLDMMAVSLNPGYVEISQAVGERHTNTYGHMHGGALMSMGDTCMGAACLSLNKKVVTLSYNMNFIKGVPDGQWVKATARVIHNGGRTMVCSTELFNREGQLVAQGSGTFFVIGKLIDELD